MTLGATRQRPFRAWPAVRPLKLTPGEKRQLALGTAASAFAFLFFLAWALRAPQSLKSALGETGWIELSTAALFFMSSVLFLVFAKRSEFLGARRSPLVYFCTVGWAALAFVCAGEELSWGQHILGFSTPEEISGGNRQREFNLHNHVIIEDVIGRHGWRAISILTVLTGLALPVLAQTAGGRRLLQWAGLPACPLSAAPLFVASYAFVKLVAALDPSLIKAGEEVRELFLGAGFLAFAAHGALRPCDLLRAKARQ